MMERLYVAYGSNMNKMQMGQRCPNAKALGKGTLNGYTLEFRGRKGSGVATIIKEENTSVPVVLWSITKDCERALDVYEGFPHLYYKKDVNIEFKGKSVKAMVYIMAKQYERKEMSARPSSYYFQVIKEGYDDFEIETSTIDKALERACNSNLIPAKVIDEIKLVAETGITNMFDTPAVRELAKELGYRKLATFLENKDNQKSYWNFILYGD